MNHESTRINTKVFIINTLLAVSPYRINFASLFVILLGAMVIFALEVPPAKGYVTDYAGLLTPVEIDRLNRKLSEYDARTSNQVVVLIIKSLEGETRESFGIKVMDKWQPGQKGKDNGVILIVAKEDRQIRIEVGYGLEHVLTDLKCALVWDKIIKPKFQEGKYSEGINDAVDSIIKEITGEFTFLHTVHTNTTASADLKQIGGWIFILIAIIFFIGIVLIGRAGRRYGSGGTWSTGGFGRGGWGGGFGGGGGFSGGGGGFSGGGGRGGGGGASGRW
ncbi:MAG: TPM domain-containing protein [Planctomycetota bacterium]|nr:TPM domain-containing protein [Planctomycetota bacterium]MDI6787670.1 TPM domain-containing protein [Planctomycetota bacterium]